VADHKLPTGKTLADDFDITRIDFGRRRDRNRFIDVPFHLYAPDSNWAPPLRVSLSALLNPDKNPFWKHAEIEGYIATRGGQPVGRIAAIVNRAHNEFHEDTVGFFGYFECGEEQDVTDALFNRAATWLTARGMTVMRGPASPSTNDECGLLVDSFDKPPLIMMPYNPPYYAALIETHGLTKAMDLYAYWMRTHGGMSDRVLRLAEALKKRARATMRNIDLKNIEAELEIIHAIYHRSWEKNWGFVPLTDEEFQHAADDLKQVADPHCALIIEVDDEPVAFGLALLDINQVMAKIPSGRLLPMGWWKLWRGIPKIDAVRVALLGVVPEFRGRGFDAMMYAHMHNIAGEVGKVGGEFSWILETNDAMRDGVAGMGGHHYKTYRMYDMPLNDA
jgi:hypothetical protein